MKSNFFAIGLIVLLGLISGGFLLSNYQERSTQLDQKASLIMREIGHRVLLQAGDSTSKVLPVKRFGSNTYLIEFQSQFNFVPDTLVKVVHTSLVAGKLPLKYTVNVLDCSNSNIIYGYQFADKDNTVVPCLGREQTKGCYVIQISFSEYSSQAWTLGYTGFAATAILLVAFVIIRRRSAKIDVNSQIQGGQFIALGQYAFDRDKQLLVLRGQRTKLTDKEAKLLGVLTAHLNQPIDRDLLMKEVWEDDGVIVGRSLDVFISKLRKRLQQDDKIKIVSIHGKGYKLEIS